MKQKKYLLALILMIYPLRHCMVGFDLMDAGYALGNYRFYDTMNETWKIATYLSNVIGMLLMHLPYGNTWIGMNVYTGLLVGVTAAGTYIYLVSHQPDDDKKELLLFISEFVALSLCWAPSVILYHYLGYLLMTVAMLLLYTAISKDNKRYFIVSGVILGICVAVRMPNITYMAFILPLWYYCFIERRIDNRWFGKLVNRTLYCIFGYVIGAAVPIGYIEIRYGIDSYPDMVASLFGMTETATDYKPTSMIMTIFGDYISYGGWLLLFTTYIIMGVIFFCVLRRQLENAYESNKRIKITCVFKILYFFGFLVLLRFCYGRGMFGIDYADNFSIYKWMIVYLLLVIILCVWTMASHKTDDSLKLWAMFLIVAIFITPLGSNNGIYPIINNLFIIAPVSVILTGEFYSKAVDSIKGDAPFAVKMIITCVMICASISGVLFGINFVFHDELEGEAKRVSVDLKCDTVANGLLTTNKKKEAIEALDTFIYDSGLKGKSLISYGQIPALSYVLNMEPAIYTTWGDLDSNSLIRLENDLESLSQSKSELAPVVILGVEFVDNLTDKTSLAYEKLTAIENYIEENNYIKVYENSDYRVYNIN